jgi:hypothetical protein
MRGREKLQELWQKDGPCPSMSQICKIGLVEWRIAHDAGWDFGNLGAVKK